MPLQTRASNKLIIIVGQSNETKEQPSVGRPVLAKESLTSPARTRFFIGGGHPINTKSAVCFAKLNQTAATGLTAYSYDEESITMLDSDLNTSLYDIDGSYVYNNESIATSAIGCPNSGTGMWTHLTEEFWENRNEWVQVVDGYSVGGTSFITEWCGSTGTGDSTVVLSPSDGGFDPNNYLSRIVDDLGSWSNSFDECLIIIQHGQADARAGSVVYDSTGATNASTQLGLYTDALNNIVDYLTTNIVPTKIYVGSSNAAGVGSVVPDTLGFAEVIVPAMQSVIIGKSLETGVMLSEEFADGSLHNYTDDHLNMRGQEAAGRLWASLLTAPDSSGGGGSSIIAENAFLLATLPTQALRDLL